MQRDALHVFGKHPCRSLTGLNYRYEMQATHCLFVCSRLWVSRGNAKEKRGMKQDRGWREWIKNSVAGRGETKIQESSCSEVKKWLMKGGRDKRTERKMATRLSECIYPSFGGISEYGQLKKREKKHFHSVRSKFGNAAPNTTILYQKKKIYTHIKDSEKAMLTQHAVHTTVC